MTAPEATVFLVDDDDAVRDALELLLDSVGISTESYSSATAFLDHYDPDRPGCLVLDIRMPAMSGMELQAALAGKGVNIPIIFLSGHGNVPMSAKAFRSGAVDFLEKPFDENVLLERIHEAIRLDRANRGATARRVSASTRLATLTRREHEVMLLIVTGHANKDIAMKLDLSHRTIETHRGRIMEKTGAQSLTELIQIALASGSHELK
ncbi:MAG: response regulator [Gammaproteobacteria bacterium]|jgi:FixJ family two-component response regulator